MFASKRAFALGLPLVLVGIAWLQELIDTLVLQGQWTLALGPGSAWWTLFTAPFSHGGPGHLLTNTVVFLPLSYLVLSQGLGAYGAVWIGVICLEIPIWLFWPVGSHGLSGVVYGLLGYLLVLGLIERRAISLGLSVLVLSLYGSALFGLLPWASPPGVSWIGHAGGFVGGVLAAIATARTTDRS
ncbi:MAG: rhomboid family intramembrane serine protease [Synechococcus sp.]